MIKTKKITLVVIILAGRPKTRERANTISILQTESIFRKRVTRG